MWVATGLMHDDLTTEQGMLYYIPQFLQVVKGFTALRSGVLTLPYLCTVAPSVLCASPTDCVNAAELIQQYLRTAYLDHWSV